MIARSLLRARGSDTALLAWALVVPCGVVAGLAVYALGPPLGHLLQPRGASQAFWQYLKPILNPQPTAHARFLLALAAPLLLSVTVVFASRRASRLRGRRLVAVASLGRVVTAGALVACLVAQSRFNAGTGAHPLRVRYFTPATLAAAALLAGAFLVLVRTPAVLHRCARLARDSRTRRLAATAVAALLTAVWLLHAVNTDASVASTPPLVWAPLPYALDETFAVVNGRTPLVDFTVQYAALWPFVAALPLIVVAKSLLVFTIAMCAITMTAMLGIFDVLRRAAGSSLTALLLYAPFLATSFFKVDGTLANRSTAANLYTAFPLRYAGPFLLAWLLARRLARGPPGASWPSLTAAVLVAIDNVEFGIPALGASVAALLWTGEGPMRRRVRDLAVSTAAGAAVALALVCALTLARAGSLPDLRRTFTYASQYVAGLNAGPLPGVLGLHMVVYLTYVAAIATASVRALDRAPNRVLTGMLAWSGVFGLGAAGYYVGEPQPAHLIVAFSAWALTLMLLAVVVVRRLVEQPSQRPSTAQLAVLFGVGVCLCSLAQTPAPWSQIARLTSRHRDLTLSVDPPPPSPYLPDPATRTFFASFAYGPTTFYVKHGTPAAILIVPGHRIADAFGIVDVDRYTGYYSVDTRERLREVIGDLRRADGNTLFVAEAETGFTDVLAQAGFGIVTTSGVVPAADAQDVVRVTWDGQAVTKWVDLGNLRPRSLHGDPGRLVTRYR